jgi:hypothetical protein
VEVSAFDHWLSGIAERYPGLLTRLGNLEARWLDPATRVRPPDRPVYVTGLARSGTTILLEKLAGLPGIASHQYRDFPFVLAPLAWNWFLDRASNAPATPTERAHKDRILVTPRSPEAMEEVVWMAFFPAIHDSTVSNVLDATTSNPAFERFYTDHIRKILELRGGTRYVAKGNYNLSRLGYLQNLFPDCRILIPIREPVGHVASLIKQHRLFCKVGREDPRTLASLQRSGHFEFGLDLRPINFGDRAAVQRVEQLWAGDEQVRGWAAYWALAYGHVAAQLATDSDLAARTLIIRYRDLCTSPAATLEAAYSHAGLTADAGLIAQQAADISAPAYYDPGFSPAELAAIEDETHEVAARFKL